MRRHATGEDPRWHSNYGYPGYGFHFARRYRHFRAVHGRFRDYTYRGVPDYPPDHHYGPGGLGSFDGPVPLRWLRRSWR